jgi:hypothetical protein
MVQTGQATDTTAMSPLPLQQHTTYLRVSAATDAEVNKIVAGLDLRALPLGADGTAKADASGSDDNGETAGESSKKQALLLDVRKSKSGATSVQLPKPHFETTVEVTYVCGGQPGTYVILGTVPGIETHDVIVFKWKKICGKGRIFGFSVVTSDNQDVIVNGDATPSFRLDTHKLEDGGGERSSNLYRVGYAQDSLKLVVHGPPSSSSSSTLEHFSSLSFNVTDLRMDPSPEKAGLSIVLDGPASTGGELERGDKVALELLFDCLLPGTTTLEIDFTVSNNDQLVTTMAFEKECHVGPLPGFDIIPVGIESSDSLAVKDGLARPNYAPSAPMAIVDATQTSIDFEIFTARSGLSVPIKKIWATAVDFEIQRDPTEELPWLFEKNNKGETQFRSPKWMRNPGRGSVFGTSGSILDSLKKKLFNHGAVRAATPTTFDAGDIFGNLGGLFRRFSKPHGNGVGNGVGNGNGGGRRLWKPNVREEPAQLPFQDNPGRDRRRSRSIVAKVSVSGTATRGKGPTQEEEGGTTTNNDPRDDPKVESNRPLTLSVLHDCTHSGSVIVTVNLVIVPEGATVLDVKNNDEEESSISSMLPAFLKAKLKQTWNSAQHKIVSFSYIKECLVGSIPGLDISMGTYQPTKKMGGYAMFHGKVTPYFLARGRTKMVVREAEKTSNFYLTLNNPEWTVEIKNVTARVLHRSDIVKSADVTVLSSTGSKISMWKSHHPIILRGSRAEYKSPRILSVAYDCIQTGVARIVLDLTLVPTRKGHTEKERSMTMSWDKKCRVPPLRGLMVSMLNPHYVDRKGAMKSFAIIDHGRPVVEYAIGTHSASVGMRWNQIQLTVSMKANSTMPIAVPYVVSNNALTEPVLDVVVGGTHLPPPMDVHEDPYGYAKDDTLFLEHDTNFVMNLDFKCGKGMNGSSIVTVVIPLRPPLREDVSTVVEYPVDVEFAMTKRCGTPRAKRKWGKQAEKFFGSTAGIATIVVFFIGLVVCMGVVWCPQVVMNMRAQLLRRNYKYKRVKLDDGLDTDDDEEFGLADSGTTTLEMRSRRRGRDVGGGESPVMSV